MCQLEEGVYCRPTSVKFNDPKFKNEIFLRIDMKHSYFSNYLFAINFSVVETVVCQKLIHVYTYCMFLLYKVTNLTLYMYLFIEIS